VESLFQHFVYRNNLTIWRLAVKLLYWMGTVVIEAERRTGFVKIAMELAAIVSLDVLDFSIKEPAQRDCPELR
jgi:hypothetical protein